MGLFSQAVEALTKAAPNRLPIATNTGVIATASGIGGPTATGQQAQLRAYGAVSTLFSAVNAITESISAVGWKLWRVQSTGDRQEVAPGHPLMELWTSVNPFYTRGEFLESVQQHIDLTGEAWIVKLRNGAGRTVELWSIRPDRMKPIPSRDEYIAGYEYSIGAERIPLAREDVIFLRIPSPMDPYRGMGVVQSLLVDLGAEKAAQEWVNAFFKNSAEPGGVIQYDDELDDAQWNKLVERWQLQHQGVQNAHRVAVLERGKWIDRKLTQRDMQFEQLRKLNQATILAAFRVPPSILGMTENVNRANAEAAEVHFARWSLTPRLERIKSAINERLAPEFGADLEFSYIDPTPKNREQDRQEADSGIQHGYLSVNEARARVGEGEVDGGDELKAPAPTPFALSAKPKRKAPANDLHPDEVDKDQETMEEAWARRLGTELSAIEAHLAQFFKRRRRVPRRVTEKIELADVDTYDWDWWVKYGTEVVDELTKAFMVVLSVQLPTTPVAQLQHLAAEYAATRGAALLQVSGDLNLANLTRERVRTLVANTIDTGASLGDLQKSLRADHAFSRSRAELVARTETATALGQGNKQAAVMQGRDEKRWVTQGDDRVSQEVCAPNETQGWISAADAFGSGHDTIPGHPDCRCVVEYRTSGGSDVDPLEGLEPEERSLELLCRECGKLLHRSASESTMVANEFYCPRCKRVQPTLMRWVATA